MGRKRTSKKEQISISVDKDIIQKLRDLEVDRSLIFTEAAKKYIENVEKQEKDKKTE